MIYLHVATVPKLSSIGVARSYLSLASTIFHTNMCAISMCAIPGT